MGRPQGNEEVTSRDGDNKSARVAATLILAGRLGFFRCLSRHDTSEARCVAHVVAFGVTFGVLYTHIKLDTWLDTYAKFIRTLVV